MNFFLLLCLGFSIGINLRQQNMRPKRGFYDSRCTCSCPPWSNWTHLIGLCWCNRAALYINQDMLLKKHVGLLRWQEWYSFSGGRQAKAHAKERVCWPSVCLNILMIKIKNKWVGRPCKKLWNRAGFWSLYKVKKLMHTNARAAMMCFTWIGWMHRLYITIGWRNCNITHWFLNWHFEASSLQFGGFWSKKCPYME